MHLREADWLNAVEKISFNSFFFAWVKYKPTLQEESKAELFILLNGCVALQSALGNSSLCQFLKLLLAHLAVTSTLRLFRGTVNLPFRSLPQVTMIEFNSNMRSFYFVFVLEGWEVWFFLFVLFSVLVATNRKWSRTKPGNQNREGELLVKSRLEVKKQIGYECIWAGSQQEMSVHLGFARPLSLTVLLLPFS